MHMGLLPVFAEYAAIVKTLLADRNTYDEFEASRSHWPVLLCLSPPNPHILIFLIC